MKVGTLAKKTGLTIRTLHYYEEVGLLAPAQRTDAGHRLYGADEVVRSLYAGARLELPATQWIGMR